MNLEPDSRGLRVLMTADTIGGVWTYALELARAFEGRQVEIALATMGAPLRPAQLREVAALSNVRLFPSNYRLEWMHDPWKDLRAAGEWLLGLASRFQPHLIHLNNYVHAALPWKQPTVVVAHSDVLSWWRAVKGGEAPGEWEEYRRQVSAGLRSADVVVAPTRSALADVQFHYGPLERTEVISNGRALSAESVDKELFVFSSGRLWDDAKNISALAEVAGQLNWPVKLAGDTQEPGGRRTLLDNVDWLGRLDARAMESVFQRAGIYCLPARYEPFGLSVLEAALAGCALILGDIPSLRELWHGAAAFVSPDKPNELRDTLNGLIADVAARRALARRARERAREFSPARMAHAYHALYHALLSATPDASARSQTLYANRTVLSLAPV